MWRATYVGRVKSVEEGELAVADAVLSRVHCKWLSTFENSVGNHDEFSL